jgi:cell pole-organizing protein PopZ
MNKPAPKEPSMDEILSSIRQIIADDDAAIVPKKPMAATPSLQPAAPAPRPFPTIASAPKPAAPAMPEPRPAMSAPQPFVPPPRAPEPASPEPLALSAEQILAEDDDTGSVSSLSFGDILAGDRDEDEPLAFIGEPELVDPEDIAFEADDEPEPYEPEAYEPASFSVAMEEPVVAPPPVASRSAPVPRPALSQPAFQQPAPRPAPSVAQAAPMPDPTLSADMAEQLLEPTTKSAVKHAFSRLSGLSMVGTGLTIEDMMREMLRPMLKEWLDENLPSIVERMVEKEIARISRGAE